MSVHPKYISQSPLSINKQIAQNMMFQKVTINHSVVKPTPILPAGWKKEETVRQNGLHNGKSIVSYVSPTGERINTLKALQAALGDKYDVTLFDWRSGKFMHNAVKHRSFNLTDAPGAKRSKSDEHDAGWNRRCSPPPLPKPILHLNHSDSKRSDKPTTHECLKQIFTERRLADRQAVDYRDGQILIPPSLPSGINPAGIPGYDKVQLLQSIIVSLASKRGPITGQDQTTAAIEKNPLALINQHQPYVKHFVVTEDDIQKQQQRVKELRKRLQSARKDTGAEDEQ